MNADERLRAIHWSVWLFGLMQLTLDVVFLIILVAPPVHADSGPAYCYSSGDWIQFPSTSGYCLDGEAPFYGPAPSYGGGNHRWPDGSDD